MKRTTFQLRLHAGVLRAGRSFGATIDHADPDWPPAPRPDIRRVLRAIGPVAVYAASNFPFAFSVAGGDTASALAAANPVIVKVHPGHPTLSAHVGELVTAALRDRGAPDGTFGLVSGLETGRRLSPTPASGRRLHRFAARRSRAVRPRGLTARPDPVLRRVGQPQSGVRDRHGGAERAKQIAEASSPPSLSALVSSARSRGCCSRPPIPDCPP